MRKRAALYVRVSTQEQAREGYSVKAQTEKLTSYAEAKNYIVVNTYTDPGYSGASLKRPGIQELLADVEKGNIDIVLVYKLDRLSRSQKNTLYLIQDIFKPHSVDFVSLQESFDTSTPFGMAMVGILSVFAELERSTITERVNMGRKERAKSGLYHGGGNYKPLGYDYNDGHLIVNEYEAQIIKDIYHLYISGNSMNSTAQTIWNKYPDRIKSKTIVRDALQNPLYIGKIRFAGETHDGEHEPIIDEETFYMAQKVRKNRGLGNSGTNKQKGLLVGKVYCAHCGARFAREVTGSRKYRYVNYTCYSRRPSSSPGMVKDPNCKNKRWKEKVLDEVVVTKIKNLDLQEVQREIKMNNRSEVFQKEIEKIDNQVNRLIELYTLTSIDVSVLDKQLTELKQKKENLYVRIENEKTRGISKETLQSLQGFDWENETLQNKLHIINELINRIEVDNEQVMFFWNFLS